MAPPKKPRALVIVESPSKAKKISSYVAPNTTVMASVGHIRDLPQFVLGVNIGDGFKPNYVIPTDKKKVVEDLRKATAKATTVFLASDPDREGESIAWHLYEVLKDIPGERKFYRVRYNEVTKGAVLNALDNPTEIDINLVNAQQARRVEDRLSGFRLSKLVSNAIRGARSAGRVQSVALRLLVDRERAIQSFVPTPYWLLGARLEKGHTLFDARLASIDGAVPRFMAYGKEIHGIESETAATEYANELSGHDLKVTSIERKRVTKRPQPPFITSTLQQAAATTLGYSPDQTMRIAQALYEEGYITYMRTDGYTVSESVRGAVEAEIKRLFGEECVPKSPNFYGNKVKNAQEAHEPIRPTDVTRTTLEETDTQRAKLYDLIWRRFVASQMTAATYERTTLTFEPTEPPATKHAYRFTASAQTVVFKGFLNIWNQSEKEDGDADRLPALAKGDVVSCREWLFESKETQPPARFNEASLVRALEENGIGRPSTYAATIRTLLSREYVKSGKGHVLTPTETGLQATDYLLSEVPDFVNVIFTAQMEDALDKIADGSLDWVTEVSDFYAKLVQWLAADPKDIDPILKLLGGVKIWREPTINARTKKVTWDDKAFVEEMNEHFAKGEPISKPQLATLTRMAISYREQLPDLPKVIDISTVDLPPDPETILELFKKAEEMMQQGKLTEWEQKFIVSLKEQFNRKGELSQKQVDMLKRIVSQESAGDNPQNEAAAKELLDALSLVTTWHEPVKRGRTTYDDEAFVKSLTTQLTEKRFLSERQFEALKKMVRSYHSQIPNYAELAEKYEIKTQIPRRSVQKATPKKKK